MSIAIQLVLNGILTASFYALIATGLSFIYSTSRIFHLALGVVAVAAGYSYWWGTRVIGMHPLVSVAFSLLVAALLGFLCNELVYEVLRKKGTKGLGYLIATLALLLFGTAVLQLIFGAAPKTYPLRSVVYVFGDVRVTQIQCIIVGVSVAFLSLFYWIQKYTKFGKALRATADNETVAMVLGINTRKMRRWAFVVSSLLAAPAGILFGLEFNLDPNMGVLMAVLGYSALVIGGVGSFAGPIIGALVIGLTEQMAVWFGGSGWRHAIAFLLLFIFLLLKPNGIFGTKSLFK